MIYDKITQMLNHQESVMEIHRETGVARNTIISLNVGRSTTETMVLTVRRELIRYILIA